MGIASDPLPRQRRSPFTWQGLYAAAVFALFCFSLLQLIAPLRCADLMEAYVRFLIGVLFGAFLFKAGLTREWCIRLYLAYLLWLLITRWLNRDFYLFHDQNLLRTELISFLMFTPGILLPPEGRRKLLNMLSLVYASFFVLVALLGLFVAVTNTYIHVPPENVWITVGSEGEIRHLNLLSSFRLTSVARLYMSWALLIYQFLRTRKKLLRALLLLGMLILHAAIALCFSRTVRICFSLSCSMLVVLLGYRYLPLRRAVLRVLALAAGFVLMLVLAYNSFELVFKGFSAALVDVAPRFEAAYDSWERKPDPEYFGVVHKPELLAEADASAGDASADDAAGQEQTAAAAADKYVAAAASVMENKFTEQRTLKGNYNLTERTVIWESGFAAIREQPAILLRGQSGKVLMNYPNLYMMVLKYSRPYAMPNMHNIFFQVLLLTGLPGLLLVLAWALLQVSRMLRVFFSRKELVPLPIAFLTIPMTAFFVYTQMEYQLFPAWDSSGRAFLLIAGVFLGLYREYFPAKAKAPVPETEAE